MRKAALRAYDRCFGGPTVAVCLLSGVLLQGCSVNVEPLMPTPILFEVNDFGPLDRIPVSEHWNLRNVYYATTRERTANMQKIDYSNRESEAVSVGMTLIGFGSNGMTWEDLSAASRSAERAETVPLSIAGIMEAGSYRYDAAGDVTDTTGAASWLLSSINESIETARDKDILIYVHGAKVNFYNASVFAAQLDHYMGRDMTAIAFSWPTRQNILAYGFGDDKARAYRSADALASFVKVLAEKTKARRINILCWSAGGRLVTAAMKELRAWQPEETPQQLSDRYRLGVVYYAAADVPVDEFVDALPAINDLAQHIIVTGSSNDGALQSATRLMGGATRIGQNSVELTDEQRKTVLAADRLEYIDLSRGSEKRGFDITGHRYWFNHTWASSDMLLAIRTDLDPEERGLEQGDQPLLWWMPDDYPQRLTRFRSLAPEDLRRR